jgi:hypothetical protein
MLGNYRVATKLVASRIVLSSIELVNYYYYYYYYPLSAKDGTNFADKR